MQGWQQTTSALCLHCSFISARNCCEQLTHNLVVKCCSKCTHLNLLQRSNSANGFAANGSVCSFLVARRIHPISYYNVDLRNRSVNTTRSPALGLCEQKHVATESGTTLHKEPDNNHEYHYFDQNPATTSILIIFRQEGMCTCTCSMAGYEIRYFPIHASLR